MRPDRYYSTNLRPFKLSKTPKLYSKSHLDFIRKRACIISKTHGVDAHHVQLKSHGVNDYLAIPLRHDLHMEYHQTGHNTFERKHGVDMQAALLANLIERIIELENQIKEH